MSTCLRDDVRYSGAPDESLLRERKLREEADRACILWDLPLRSGRGNDEERERERECNFWGWLEKVSVWGSDVVRVSGGPRTER